MKSYQRDFRRQMNFTLIEIFTIALMLLMNSKINQFFIKYSTTIHVKNRDVTNDCF